MILTRNEIAYLAASFTEKTPIGLLGNIKGVPDGTEYASLVEKGIIKGNAYDPEALSMLQLVAAPERCARLLIQNDFCVIEKYTYRRGAELILTENSGGNLIFSKPADFSDVIIGLSEFFGLSKIKSTDLKITLQAEEMLTLLSMIDLVRKQSLLTYVGQTKAAQSFSLAEVSRELDAPFANGLVTLLVKNFNYEVPAADKIGLLLGALIDQGYVTFSGNYTLTEELSALAGSFLIPESMVLFETFQMTAGGEVASAGSLCTAAGLHDVLSFIFEGKEITLTAISASQMLTSIEAFLGCPDLVSLIKETAPAQAAPQAAEASVAENSWRCSCGSQNTGNFCFSCGRKRP